MENLGVIEIGIILGLVAVKFGVIIFTVLYVKNRAEKKKQLFLEMEAQRRTAQSVKIDAENQ